MIKIEKIWTYENEAGDCCEGWWNESYNLTVNDEFVGNFTDLEDLLVEASSRTMLLDFIDEDPPTDD